MAMGRLAFIFLVALLVAGCVSPRGGVGSVASGGNELRVDFAKVKASQWHYPLPGAKVISPYGGARKNHTGTDMKTKAGDKIRAAFAGEVVLSEVRSGYGNCVVVKHLNGLETLYAHNAKNLVKKGEKVKCGQVIALVGRTGRATTEHLHFEVRAYGKAFDSELLFDHNKNQLRHVVLTAKRGKSGKVDVHVRKRK